MGESRTHNVRAGHAESGKVVLEYGPDEKFDLVKAHEDGHDTLCISGYVIYYAGAIYPEWRVGFNTKKGDCP